MSVAGEARGLSLQANWRIVEQGAQSIQRWRRQALIQGHTFPSFFLDEGIRQTPEGK